MTKKSRKLRSFEKGDAGIEFKVINSIEERFSIRSKCF
jgi:hypothetical protein